eukprot:scaffold93633_cov69-Phaeocystis_antarctica.AAC.1
MGLAPCSRIYYGSRSEPAGRRHCASAALGHVHAYVWWRMKQASPLSSHRGAQDTHVVRLSLSLCRGKISKSRGP